jgi:hypothetical protein
MMKGYREHFSFLGMKMPKMHGGIEREAGAHPGATGGHPAAGGHPGASRPVRS